MENGRPVLGTTSGSTSAGAPTDTQMANYTIPGILHFVKHEWSRFEKERAAWEVEKAELEVRPWPTNVMNIEIRRRFHALWSVVMWGPACVRHK